MSKLQNKMPSRRDVSFTVTQILKSHDDIQVLTKRIEYLESLHQCTCPSQEEQSKMKNASWHCPLHGRTEIIFQSHMTRMIDKSGGHIAK